MAQAPGASGVPIFLSGAEWVFEHKMQCRRLMVEDGYSPEDAMRKVVASVSDRDIVLYPTDVRRELQLLRGGHGRYG